MTTIDELFTNDEIIETVKSVFAKWFADRARAEGMDATYWKTADMADAVNEILTYADLGGLSFYPRNEKKWKGENDA